MPALVLGQSWWELGTEATGATACTGSCRRGAQLRSCPPSLAALLLYAAALSAPSTGSCEGGGVAPAHATLLAAKEAGGALVRRNFAAVADPGGR